MHSGTECGAYLFVSSTRLILYNIRPYDENGAASPHRDKTKEAPMRLWSLHPRYLDSKGLVALWREALLAQSVLLGRTKGYGNHPQLLRFKKAEDAEAAIATFLGHVADEADRRGYRFDRKKIAERGASGTLPLHAGQLAYEREHLLRKLKTRDPERYRELKALETVEAHPLFDVIDGGIEAWEVVRPAE